MHSHGPQAPLFRYRFQAFARNWKRWRGLEALSFEINVDGHETEKIRGSIIQIVEKVLVKPGWTALRQVSFKISIACCLVSKGDSAKLWEALKFSTRTHY